MQLVLFFSAFRTSEIQLRRKHTNFQTRVFFLSGPPGPQQQLSGPHTVSQGGFNLGEKTTSALRRCDEPCL